MRFGSSDCSLSSQTATMKAFEGKPGSNPTAIAGCDGDPLSTQFHEPSTRSDISAERLFFSFSFFLLLFFSIFNSIMSFASAGLFFVLFNI